MVRRMLRRWLRLLLAGGLIRQGRCRNARLPGLVWVYLPTPAPDVILRHQHSFLTMDGARVAAKVVSISAEIRPISTKVRSVLPEVLPVGAEIRPVAREVLVGNPSIRAIVGDVPTVRSDVGLVTR